MTGFIKLPRDFIEWEWWNRQPHHPLFEWLLIKARVVDQKVQGILVRRGSVLTTWAEMQQAVGCSRGALSRALKDFLECGEIILKTDCRKTVVTICHYEDYNGNNNTLWTDSGPIADCQRTDTHLYKGERENEKDIYSARETLPDDGFVSDSDCRLWQQRYNAIAASFGARPAEKITTSRRILITQRVRERGRGSVDILFARLAESAYFFADGSRGFRGDFTNLWTADVYTKVLEGYYIPKPKKKETAAQKAQPQTIDANVVKESRQPRQEYEAQMRQYAIDHPESKAAQIVASWDQAQPRIASS